MPSSVIARASLPALCLVTFAACSDSVTPTGPRSAAQATAAFAATRGNSTDIQLSGSASSGSPDAGASVSYTFQLRNGSANAASNVVFTDTLPAGTAYLGAGVTGVPFGCSQAMMVVTCNIGTVLKGSQYNIVVTITAPITAGEFTNTGIVTTDTPDSQSSNNSAAVTAQIRTALAACAQTAGLTTSDGLVMFGVLDSFSAYEQFELQVNGVNYWVVTNYFDGTQPLTTVINLDCKTSPAQFVQVGNFVNVSGTLDGTTITLPGQTASLPVLRANVIQVLTHKDAF